MSSTAKFKRIPITEIHPNQYNPNKMSPAMFTRAVNSIKKYGFISPILVEPRSDSGYTIVNGEHRWKAAKKLKIESIPCMVLESGLSQAHVKLLGTALNEIHGENDPELYIAMVKDILQEVDEGDLLDVLPMDGSDLREMLRGAEEPEEESSNHEEDDDEPAPAKTKDKVDDSTRELSFVIPKSDYPVVKQALRKAAKTAKTTSQVQSFIVLCQAYLDTASN